MKGEHEVAAPATQGAALRNELSGTSTARERVLSFIPVTDRQLSLVGISTAVLEGGQGSPVILLHGPAGYAAHWMRIISDLAATHRVIAPDLPGHGASTFDDALDLDRVLAWLDALIQQTCHSSPTLVGQLIGGAIAARFAARYADRIERLILVDTFGLRAFRPPPDFAFALSDYLNGPSESSHEDLWRYCAYDLDRLRATMGERWQAFEAYNLECARRLGATSDVSALMTAAGLAEIPSQELERIAVPTSLIWGRHDMANPLPIAEAASARYGWPLHIVEEAADVPDVEQPQAFMQALRVALTSH
jgi:pimeloyl-ACP methyl ester carboxylesterase